MGILDSLDKKLDQLNDTIRVGDGADGGGSKLIGRRAFLTDPYLEVASSAGSYRVRYTRLSTRMLRESAMRDSIVSSIIRHRRTQVEAHCAIPHTRFDTGFTFARRDGAELTSDDHDNLNILTHYMYYCGMQEQTPIDDRSTLGTELGMVVQDALTFGHVAIEKVRDKLGGLQRFRHVPAESVFHANRRMTKKQHVELANAQMQGFEGMGISKEGEVTPDPIVPVRYLQVIDSREVANFSEETMIFKLFQPPSFMDNNGYSMSLVEACILSITRHLQAENYNALFFTHGFAARGLLHLKGNVSQQNLQMFRNQFNAVINGNTNSWRTPIIAGLDEVQWVPLAGTSRDMEYIQYTDHLIRTICAQAQIDPTEIGFDYLSRGTQQSTLNTPDNEWKLTASMERGLVPILRFIEDIVNHDIMPEMNKKLAGMYMFKFVGLDSENRQQEVTRLQAEMTVHCTMNDILQQVKKPKLEKEVGGDLPMNAIWWGMVKELLTVGELREKFMDDKGASEREELKYIPSQAFMAWQQALQAKKQQAKTNKQQDDAQKLEEKQTTMSGANAIPPEGPSATPPVKY